MSETLTINIIINHKGKNVGVQVFIRDGMALARFSDVEVGKLIATDKMKKNKRINWNDEQGLMSETFPHKSSHEILKIISKELQSNDTTKPKTSK